MSGKYSLNQFMCDFIAINKNPELERLAPPGRVGEYIGERLPAYFHSQYGENGKAFGDLYIKVLGVVIEYLERHRPSLVSAIERTPNSLLIAIFYLVAEKGIASPTREQIEATEATQTPKS